MSALEEIAILVSREDKFDAMARLEPATYDNVRKAFADEMGIRVTTLDAEIAKRRKPAASSSMAFADIEPAEDPVDGAELLDILAAEIRRYLVMPDASRDAVALWIVLTWCYSAFFLIPMILISSPQKRCGKSTLLILLRKLTRKAVLASNLSPSSIFRIVNDVSPTLLLDEADTWINNPNNNDLRGVLNAGHSLDTANILRVEGDPLQVRAFNCFCPKAIAGIGRVPDTIEDRSISIEMRRRTPSESVEQLRQDRLNLEYVQRLCARFAVDTMPSLSAADPVVPTELHDRAADNWRPLLAIADTAGGLWSARARAAAITLTLKDEDEDSLTILLLADIREIIKAEGRIRSTELALRLSKLDTRPWAEMGRDGISSNKLARMLKPFKIKPKTVRFNRLETDKGYTNEDFTDAFLRYLPNIDRATVTSSQTDKSCGNDQNQTDTGFSDVTVATVTRDFGVTIENAVNHGKSGDCDDVTVAAADYGVSDGEAF